MRSRIIALLLLSITLLFTITAFQSSTILHQTVANQPPASDDGAKPEGMAGSQVVLRAADFDFDSFIPPPIVTGGLNQNSRAATINVTYTGFTAEAQAAFQYAVDIWETLITSTVTIEVDATWTILGGSTLGSAGPVGFWRNFSGAPVANTWYPVAMANSLNGSDLDAGGADIVAQFNSNFTWYLGLDGIPNSGEYDLVTVVMHELGHGLGFTGSGAYDDGTGTVECAGVAGQGCVTRLGDPRTYDNFVEDSSGLSVLGYPTPSPALGTLFTSGNLFWNSPRAALINGGPPELYAPGTWDQGSSYSHLDETVFPPANPHSLMTPQLASMEAIHDPGQITLCMFEDMGWDAACVVPTAAEWTGAAGTNWSDGGNWDIGVAPTSVVTVTIPSGVSFPTLDVDTTIGSLTVASGAQINMNANTLSLVGDLAVAGTFNGTGGTVTMVGDTAQAISVTGGQLFNLDIGDGTTGQTVSLNSDLTVAGDLTFESGAVLDANSATLTVGGVWQDNGGGTTFVADTSTVVMMAAAAAAPFTTTPYTSDAAGSWWRYSAPPPDVTWGFDSSATAPNSPYSGWVQRYPDPATGPPPQDASDYDISVQNFVLTAGVTYDVSLNYGASASSPAQKLQVLIGLGNTPVGLTNLVIDLPAITNTTWQQATGTFTPSTSGTYYIGFFTNVTDNDESVAFDDILIEATIVPDLTFNNLTISGDVTFSSDVVVGGNMTVQSGSSIDLQGNTLTVEGTFANSGDLSQTLDVPGSGTTRFLHITDAAVTMDKYFGVDLTPAGSPLGSTTVVVSGNQAGCAAGTDLGFVSRCVDVTPTTAADTTVRVWYTEAERGGLDASKLVLYHNGGTWAVAGSSSSGSEGGTTCAAVGGSACWVEAAGVTSFSPFAPGLDTSPTAVRLGGLNAVSPAGWEIGVWILLSFVIGLTYVSWINRRRPPA